MDQAIFRVQNFGALIIIIPIVVAIATSVAIGITIVTSPPTVIPAREGPGGQGRGPGPAAGPWVASKWQPKANYKVRWVPSSK